MKLLTPLSLFAILLSGCGVSDLAKSAADATACKALDSTMTTITNSYQSGLIDSGLVSKIDKLVGEKARGLLSTGLASDLNLLTDTLAGTNSAQSTKDQIKKLTDSISKRCADAGVSSLGN